MTARRLQAAARAETARVYTATTRQDDTYRALLAQAEAAIARCEAEARTKQPARPVGVSDETRVLIEQALARGETVARIIDTLGVDYATVRAARKRLMRGAA